MERLDGRVHAFLVLEEILAGTHTNYLKLTFGPI
jgi:hypothetical protein